jgi:hypothetical protein
VPVRLSCIGLDVEAGDVGDVPVARLTAYAPGVCIPETLTREATLRLVSALLDCFDWPDPPAVAVAKPPLLYAVSSADDDNLRSVACMPSGGVGISAPGSLE